MDKKDLYNLLNTSYVNQKEAKDKLKNDYNYDSELSTNKNKIFVDKDNKPHIVSRGSKTLGDWIDNGLIAVGLTKHTHGYKELERTVKKVNEKYDNKPNLYGHSQAGLFVENINKNDKNNAYTLNKAVGLGDVGKKISEKQEDYIVSNDLPSYLHFTQKKPK